MAAPEVVEKKQYRGEPTDVWSAGILLYALLVGEFPFSHPNILALFDQIKKGQYALPDYLSEDAQDLVRRMLTRDAFLRPTVEQVLDHPWLAKRDEPVVVDLRLPPSWFTP
jgi:serine/threonine protein kinase